MCLLGAGGGQPLRDAMDKHRQRRLRRRLSASRYLEVTCNDGASILAAINLGHVGSARS